MVQIAGYDMCIYKKKIIENRAVRHGSVHFYSSKETEKQVEIILEMMDW